jgi:hypothetical protein
VKGFQVRLADEAHESVKRIANVRGVSAADVVRTALEVYVIGIAFAEEGRRLVWEDSTSGEKTEVLIPGFTRDFARRILQDKRRCV